MFLFLVFTWYLPFYGYFWFIKSEFFTRAPRKLNPAPVLAPIAKSVSAGLEILLPIPLGMLVKTPSFTLPAVLGTFPAIGPLVKFTDP